MEKKRSFEGSGRRYGTERIKPQSKEELLNQVKHKLYLMKWIPRGNEMPFRIKLDIVELIEVLMYSGDKFPYLIFFDIDEKGRLGNLSIYNDPHYTNNMPDGLQGKPMIYPWPSMFDKDIRVLTSDINHYASQGYTRLALGGTVDHFLVMGIPKPELFKGERPIFQVK